jgi:hypothetical protein
MEGHPQDASDAGAAISRAVLCSRDQALLGDFDGALLTLDKASEIGGISDADKIQLHREAARVLMRRGFPLLTKDCLDQAIAIPTQPDDSTKRLSLLVHRSYISSVGCGDELDHNMPNMFWKKLNNMLHRI